MAMILDAKAVFGTWARRAVDISLETLLKLWSKQGVNRGCALSTVGVFFDAEEGNRLTALAAAEHPEIIPMATIDPRSHPRCLKALEATEKEAFPLIAFFPETQGWPIDSLFFGQIVRELAGRGCALSVEAHHAGLPSAVARQVRELSVKVVLSGVGYQNMAEALAVVRACPNFYLDTYGFSAPYSLEIAAAEIGAERLLFASLSPLSYLSSSKLLVQYSDLPDETKSAILGGNLARLVGLKEEIAAA